MADDHVECGGGTFEDIGEETGVDGWLLVEKVDFAAEGLLVGQVGGEDLSLETLGDGVVELELGVKSVGGGPCLGQGKTYSWSVLYRRLLLLERLYSIAEFDRT